MKFLAGIPYPILIAASLLLGLAPFTPKPHLVEKLQMLLAGELRRPIDIFDLVMHLAPSLLLIAKFLQERFPTRRP